MNRSIETFALFLAVVLCGPLAAEDAKSEANRLVGTWKLVAARYGGRQSELPARQAMLKHMTGTHYTWVTYDAGGQVTRTAGGPYTFDGQKMESTPEYGMGRDFALIRGKRQSYTVAVEGGRFHQRGVLSDGTALEEVWERVKSAQ